MVALLSIGLGPQHAAAAWPRIVGVEGGLVRGTTDPAPEARVAVFRGIPYAAAPTGEKRWRAPQPVPAWGGVRDATRPGAICPQLEPDPPSDETDISGLRIDEDCLNLDIWSGAARAGERRPVIVWFHGGGRGAGGASQPLFNGASLARKGAVVVTVNYRGGPLGLLATPELSRENVNGVSGNYGLLDDIAALKWVRRNIARFGGDPANVTIAGQSFGSGSAHFLTLSPLTRGLFHRMINESHALASHDPLLMQVAMKYLPLKDAEADGTRFMAIAGATSVADLRAMSWQRLFAAFRASSRDLPWSYVVDGYVLTRNFAQSYAAGTQQDVGELGGENRDENGAAADTAFDLVEQGRAARPSTPPFTGLAGYIGYARKRYGALADEFLALYPAANDREAFIAANASIRDNQRISLWTWATEFSQHRSRPIYQYFFTKAPPGPDRALTGVYHGAEIRYTFDNPKPNWSAEDRRVAAIMSSYWVNFARTGDPNGPGLPHWPAFDGRTPQVMELGGQFGPVPLADPAKVRFWQRFYAAQPAH